MTLNDLLFGKNSFISPMTDFQLRVFKDKDNYDKILNSELNFNIYNFDERDDFDYITNVSYLEGCSQEFYDEVKKYLDYEVFDIHGDFYTKYGCACLIITLKERK